MRPVTDRTARTDATEQVPNLRDYLLWLAIVVIAALATQLPTL